MERIFYTDFISTILLKKVSGYERLNDATLIGFISVGDCDF